MPTGRSPGRRATRAGRSASRAQGPGGPEVRQVPDPFRGPSVTGHDGRARGLVRPGGARHRELPPVTAHPTPSHWARIVPTSASHAVTPLELFFDLVFVFAITQITAFMAEDIGWRSALRGLVLFALLWLAWRGYAWLGNQARADDGAL